jgi:bifunctional enzyme CysN/CysC
MVREISYRLDINSLHRDEGADSLGLNEIGRVALRLTQPIFCDSYARNRMTGGMILIDEATSATVGAAMIIDPS